MNYGTDLTGLNLKEMLGKCRAAWQVTVGANLHPLIFRFREYLYNTIQITNLFKLDYGHDNFFSK